MVFNYRMVFGCIVLSLAVAPAMAQVSQSSCHTTGTVGTCSEFISTFCADVSASSFHPLENGSRCFNKNGYKCDLIAYNTGTPNDNGPPSLLHCNNILNSITKSCTMGGKAKLDPQHPYTFTIDPNAGSCAPTFTVGFTKK
ncbi:hypothetical protein B0H34DRAFT_803174 [Crassisporium funariophilum]|nr:hypothetical protein B0H34DRAFT_803174 [Crassisporium funariophilum]